MGASDLNEFTTYILYFLAIDIHNRQYNEAIETLVHMSTQIA